MHIGRTIVKTWLAVLAALLFPCIAQAQNTEARAILEQAAEAMGGLERLQSLDTMVYTGFGQRVYHQGGGALSGDPAAPQKWQALADVQRTFYLRQGSAINQERRGFEFPFAGDFGMNFARVDEAQGGVQVYDHPLPALLGALAPDALLGPVSVEDGVQVFEITPRNSTRRAWIGLDPVTHLPRFTRWVAPHPVLGDLTTTAWFTGYLPFDGVLLPMGLRQVLDWRDQVNLMFQIDSYRLNVPPATVPQAPWFPPMPVPQWTPATITPISQGLWDVRVGTSGGPIIEFADHLVMFEAYGDEQQTLTRIDAANRLVPGKQVTAVIVTHHHFDHTGGLRAALSRGLEVYAHRGAEGILREIAARPAVMFPDALARAPHPLVFHPVDERLVLEDATRRLELLHVVGHGHMAEALFAWLPGERVMMEGDLGDEAWDFHWWAGAMQANIDHYGISPLIDVAVHGTGPLPIAQALANNQRQAEGAMALCQSTAAGGRYVMGCPVQYDAQGPVELAPR